jgi:VWFA-related protein
MRTAISTCAGLALVALVAALTSSSPAAQAPAQPTFRAGVDLITIEVVVLDGEGRQVDSFDADDFTVEVDGRPRSVVSAQYYTSREALVPGAPDQARPPRAASAPALDPGSNLIVFAMDVGATSPGSRAQVLATANAVLDRLPPGDRVATVAIPLRARDLTFTGNREATKRSLLDLNGWSPRLGGQLEFSIVEAQGQERNEPIWTKVIGRVCTNADPFNRDACRSNLESDARALVQEANSRAATSTTALEGLLRALARIDGPKTVLYFSEELATDGARVEVARVVRAAAAARTRIHVMHPQPAMSDAGYTSIRYEPQKERQRQIEGLEYVSDWTGGAIFELGPEQEVAARLLSELAGRYLVLVETGPDDRDGKPHAITVRVPNRQVTVRARREFAADNVRTLSTSTNPVAEPPTPASPAETPAAPVVAAPPTASGPTPPAPAIPASAVPVPGAAAARVRRASFAVTVDPLHADRRSAETLEVQRELMAAIAARGFVVAESPRTAAIHVELAGQRQLGGGRTALPSQNRFGSDAVFLVRATVRAGRNIAEIRGRNQANRDVVRSASQETARLIEQWLGESEAVVTEPRASAAPPASTVVPAQELLPRMRAYVGAYESTLAGIVAEERYVQTYSQRVNPYPAPARRLRRELRSKMGFAWFPSPGTWFGFRDVLEADGAPVRDRQQRLEQLFLSRNFPSAEQLGRVAASSARFNIGPARRNFNVPTMTLLVASPANQGRFSFELRGYDVVDGVRVAVIAFSETGSPTLITRDGRDWPSRGMLWVEPQSGSIWRTDLQLSDRDIETRHTTWFARDTRLGLLVPVRMREIYDYRERLDEYVEALADYSKVRRFKTEAVGEPMVRR